MGWRGCSAYAPGMPLRACCARTRPLSSGTKGDGVDSCLRRNDGFAPRPPRASPAHCVRAPLRWREGGLLSVTFTLALSHRGRGDDGGRAGTPCIPLRACCARTRPLSSGTKGDGVDSCLRRGDGGCVGSAVAAPRLPRASPAHCVRAPLRWGEGGLLAVALTLALSHRGRGDDGGRPGTPCIPLRACCARTRPLSSGTKGDGVDSCLRRNDEGLRGNDGGLWE